MREYGKTENLFARDPDTHMLTPDFKIPEVGLIRNDRWIVTEKIDGTNIRVIIHADGDVEVRGRSDNANLPKGLQEALFTNMDVADGKIAEGDLDVLRDVCGVVPNPDRPIGFCLYGEGYGAGIQKNGGRYSLTKELAVFDLATFIDQPVEGVESHPALAFRTWSTMVAAAEVLGLEHVPMISHEASLASIIELVYRGFTTTVPGAPQTVENNAEGIVARTDPYLYYGRNKSRLMFKCKTEDLQKNEESLGLDRSTPVGIAEWNTDWVRVQV